MINCRVCDVELNDSNWSPSNKKHPSYICKKCDNNRRKERYRKNIIVSRDVNGNRFLIKCKKRKHTFKCEMCDEEVERTSYHHWDDGHPEWGMWICDTCHRFYEFIERGFTKECFDKYINLKKKIENTSV